MPVSPELRSLFDRLAAKHLEQRRHGLQEIAKLQAKISSLRCEVQRMKARSRGRPWLSRQRLRHFQVPETSQLPKDLPDAHHNSDKPEEHHLENNVSNPTFATTTVGTSCSSLQATSSMEATSSTPSGDHSVNGRRSKLKKRFGLRRMESIRNMTLFGKLHYFMSSDYYEMVVGCLILLSVSCIGLRSHYHGFDIGYSLGYERYDEPSADQWPGAASFFAVSNDVFLFVFTADLVLRLFVLRLAFFKSRFDLLDVMVVFVSWLEVLKTLNFNPTLLRMLRLLKFGRAIRVLRNPQLVEPVTTLIRCVIACLTTLFWSACIFLVLNCIGGAVISVIVMDFLVDPNIDMENRHDLFKFYGTFTRSLTTMFEVIFANWTPACRVLTENISEWFGLFFICYRCLAGYAVLVTVDAVFVQYTMKVAQRDDELMISAKANQQKFYAEKLKHLFDELDSSGDGALTKEEFQLLIQDERLKALFSVLGIDPNDIEELWELMDDGDGAITSQEFVQGAVRLRGTAKGLDMLGLTNLMEKLLTHVSQIARHSAQLCIELRKFDGNVADSCRPDCQVQSATF